jgi:hypothetical protein
MARAKKSTTKKTKKSPAKKAAAKKSAAKKPAKKSPMKYPSMKTATTKSGKKVVLLSGGNPQIAKADGDAPVQAYIDAMPGWKSDIGERLDKLIVKTVPVVKKCVRYNSPFYGIEDNGWFLSTHVFTKFVRVSFLKGIELKPLPPGGTPTSGEGRWIDVYEDGFDAKQMADWIKQAASIPGWIFFTEGS